MKQFSLEKYLKNPNRKVVTRDGRSVKIHCTDYIGFGPIIAKVEGNNFSQMFYSDGRSSRYEESHYDLFFVPEKHVGWINLYKNEDGISWISPNYFTSQKEAEKEGKTHTCSVTTIKIEWED